MNDSDFKKLLNIKTYCQDILGFIDRFGNDYETFESDNAYYYAVSMSIFQIGELANGLSDEFRRQHQSEVEWSEIRGLRNWIAHAYGDADDSIIWSVAVNDIPRLLAFCESQITSLR